MKNKNSRVTILDQFFNHVTFQFNTNVKDLGPLNYFLGLDVSYISDGIVQTQKKFTQEIIRDCDITAFHKAVTSFPLNLML